MISAFELYRVTGLIGPPLQQHPLVHQRRRLQRARVQGRRAHLLPRNRDAHRRGLLCRRARRRAHRQEHPAPRRRRARRDPGQPRLLDRAPLAPPRRRHAQHVPLRTHRATPARSASSARSSSTSTAADPPRANALHVTEPPPMTVRRPPRLRQDKRTGYYYADFYEPSRAPARKWVALHVKNRRVAEKQLARVAAAYLEGREDPWVVTPPAPAAPLLSASPPPSPASSPPAPWTVRAGAPSPTARVRPASAP